MDRPHLLLELRPLPRTDSHSDYPRLRKILKALLRSHGYRLMSLAVVPPAPPNLRAGAGGA